MNNQVNEVLKKIREVCDLKRLEFGCRYTYQLLPNPEIFTDGMLLEEWPNDKINKNGTVKKANYIVESHPLGSTSPDEIIEIIGLPVQLNHLLLAIHVHRPGVTFAGAGEMIEWNGEEGVDCRINTFGIYYNLQKSVEDNLRSNPELTKWVHGVIIGNE